MQPTSTGRAPLRRIAGNRVVQVSTLGLFVLAVFATLYVARDLIMPVVIAVMLALVLSPLIRALGLLRVPKMLAALLVVFAAFGSAAAMGYALYAPVVGWFEGASQNLLVVEQKLGVLKKPVEDVKKAADEAERMANVAGDEKPTVVVAEKGLLQQVFDQAQYFVLQVSLVLLLLFYLLSSGHLFTEKIVAVLRKPAHRRQALEIVQQAQGDISSYLFTITLINVGLGAAVGGAMYLLGMPDPLLWGVLAGVLNFVPYIGPTATAAMLVLVALTTFPGYGRALAVGATYLVLVVVESEFVKPLLLGRRLLVNPVVIVLSLVLWGWLWGIPGVLLAIPLIVAFKILCDKVPLLQPIGTLLDSRPEEQRTAEAQPDDIPTNITVTTGTASVSAEGKAHSAADPETAREYPPAEKATL